MLFTVAYSPLLFSYSLVGNYDIDSVILKAINPH